MRQYKKTILENNSEKFKKLLLRQFSGYGIPIISKVVVKQVMNKFDEHLIGVVTDKDPAAPQHFRSRFEELLYESIDNSLVVTDKTVSISFGDKSKLGYDGVTEDPITTMVYILEGVLGEYAFLDAKLIRRIFKYKAYLGRYKGGYLISKDAFFDGNFDASVNWDTVKWGFSHKGPIDVFDIDVSVVDAVVSETIRRTCEEFSAILRSNSK